MAICLAPAAFRRVVLSGTDMGFRFTHLQEPRLMRSSGDVRKRQAWQARLARYRSSGLSVSQFCEQEQVSTNTFYYWAKRLKTTSARTSAAHPASLRTRRSATPATDGNAQGAAVRFRCSSGTEVWVPADCLGAIRCLAECLASAGDRCGEFQEVIVKA